MDYGDIYRYRFNELIQVIKRSRDHLDTPPAPADVAQDSLHVIDIAGGAFRTYQSMIDHNEGWAIRAIECIARNVLDKKGVEYDVPEYQETAPTGRIRRIHPFALRMRINGENVAFVFRYSVTQGLVRLRKAFKAYGDIDRIRFFLLYSPDGNTDRIDMLNDLEGKEDERRLRFDILKSFFDEFVGESEYETFIKHANDFNDRARRLIGFQATMIPTNEAIAKFREDVANNIKDNEDSLKAMLPANIFQTQKDILVRNYFHRGLYKALTGETDFADSFVSSEWYYSLHTPTEAIDQTGIVTGYLKSVEQLLYAVLRLSGSADAPTSEDEEPDTALGTLIRRVKAIRYDNNVCNVNGFVMRHVVDTLYTFKDVERNGHLHSKNIYEEDEINAIRRQAMYLHFLILGSFKVEDGDYHCLGIKDDSGSCEGGIDLELFRSNVTNWASSIILYDIPPTAVGVAFMLVKFVGKPWELNVQALSEVHEEEFDDLSWNHHLLSSASMTNYQLVWDADWSWDEGLHIVSDVLRNYLNSDSPSAVKLRHIPWVLLGNMKVHEVLQGK